MGLDVEALKIRMAEFDARAEGESMSPMRRELEMKGRVWREPPHDFLIEYGRDYAVGPHSFALPRGPMKMCYMNALHLAIDMPHLTYVEGKVAIHGVSIDHAWCIDEEGVVVDPTVRDPENISNYFGVPLRTDYIRKAVVWNKFYGLLDYFYAGKTAPKLYELGLEAGQQWLLDQPVRPPRKKKAAR